MLELIKYLVNYLIDVLHPIHLEEWDFGTIPPRKRMIGSFMKPSYISADTIVRYFSLSSFSREELIEQLDMDRQWEDRLSYISGTPITYRSSDYPTVKEVKDMLDENSPSSDCRDVILYKKFLTKEAFDNIYHRQEDYYEGLNHDYINDNYLYENDAYMAIMCARNHVRMIYTPSSRVPYGYFTEDGVFLRNPHHPHHRKKYYKL